MRNTEPHLHFEDFAIGQSAEFGSYRVPREELVAFAAEFDPQAFHIDETAARASLLGGLAASGWHVCAMLMRMIYDSYLYRSAGMGSPGIDEVRWLRPVFAGETLRARSTVLSKRVSAKRPEMGIITMRWEAFNEAGELKCVMTGVNLIKVKAP